MAEPDGTLLGEGKHRKVFTCDDPGLVVKYAIDRDDRAHNLRERDVWALVDGRPEAEFLARVVDCSPDGRWLIQERMAPPIAAPWIREHRPKIVDTGRVDNYGLRGGRLILVDYATPGVLDLARQKWG